ncbi:hypothetical protein R3P38DRAFT_2801788 [Favolaschia claudopus]|uniref:Uncharacterized protein n=1 Tax=Favolaschia claudopus TaxID=2862362 RepID=A0AAV9ZUP0_9AGAR
MRPTGRPAGCVDVVKALEQRFSWIIRSLEGRIENKNPWLWLYFSGLAGLTQPNFLLLWTSNTRRQFDSDALPLHIWLWSYRIIRGLLAGSPMTLTQASVNPGLEFELTLEVLCYTYLWQLDSPNSGNKFRKSRTRPHQSVEIPFTGS